MAVLETGVPSALRFALALASYVTGEIEPLIVWPKASVEVMLNVFEPSPSVTLIE